VVGSRTFVLSLAVVATIALRKPGGWGEIPGEKMGEILLVTALGEELIFRGILFALVLVATSATTAPRGGADRSGWWLVSVAFGLWHVGDAALAAKESSLPWGLLAAGVIAFTTLASQWACCVSDTRRGPFSARS
jgi:membrane protease YdiL (CAAX protease family)